MESLITENSTELSRKRSIDQLVDISADFDLSDLELDDFASQDKKRPCWDKPQEVIAAILERRKNASYNNIQKPQEQSLIRKKDSSSITKSVPKWNFQAVTNEDGIRFYVRVSDRKYEPPNYKKASRLLLKPISELKNEAEQIILRQQQKRFQLPKSENLQHMSSELWVDKYKPRKYIELLSDENVNRKLLYWLKLWDKIVFNKDPTIKPKKIQPLANENSKGKFKGKFQKKEDPLPECDSKGFPVQRVALLSGPPGLGKTTLAQVAAKHAGYNIVEINASDERGPEAFREALLSSTQMKSVLDQEKKPNCLILDEIDGAPSASIDLLIKFIQGKLLPKGKSAKDKVKKENDGCKRPIICICNDLYTPSLRPLRTTSLLINVPEITPSNLAERLSEITRKEGLHIDSFILEQLAEKSACDVRACLGILQYSGAGSNILEKLDFGLKDMRKGLFDAWRDMLQVPMSKKGYLSVPERAQKVIKITHQVDTDRLMQGIFHNYPEISNDKLEAVVDSLQWFQFYDQISKLISEHQTWFLMPYTTSAFVNWHLRLARLQSPKISYPSSFFEVNQKKERNNAILSITKKSSKYDVLTLVSEVLPYLPDLLTPRLRSVNAQLYSAKEKAELDRLINLMLDFGLSFVQERKQQGGYEYILDPNIWDIATFPDCKARSQLPYAVKQIVIQELETARLQRAAIASGVVSNDEISENSQKSKDLAKKTKQKSPVKPSEPTNVPNHLRQTLNPVQVEPIQDKKSRNFFASFQLLGKENQKKKREQDKADGLLDETTDNEDEVVKEKRDIFRSDYWYQYIEGYSNAVRRTITMEKLL